MSDCRYHTDHETRIKRLEVAVERICDKLGSPAVTVAIIALLGSMFTGSMAFLGVVLAPAIKAWMGWGG